MKVSHVLEFPTTTFATGNHSSAFSFSSEVLTSTGLLGILPGLHILIILSESTFSLVASYILVLEHHTSLERSRSHAANSFSRDLQKYEDFGDICISDSEMFISWHDPFSSTTRNNIVGWLLNMLVCRKNSRSYVLQASIASS